MEKVIECPFCGEETIHIVHQPFVARKSLSMSRFGTGGPRYTKESFKILSGCDLCSKTRKEVEKALEGTERLKHADRIDMLKKRGLPLVLGSG